VDTWQVILTLAAVVMLVWVMKARKKQHAAFLERYARENVCEHLRPVLEALLARGHVVRRAGQRSADLPVEIHLAPPFDARTVWGELRLEEPLRLSDRNVVLCPEDWCEIRSTDE